MKRSDISVEHSREIRAYSESQFYQCGFDPTDYHWAEKAGTFSGTLMCKRWAKNPSLVAYFLMDNGEKIMCNAWQNNDYLELDKIPMGDKVTLLFTKSRSGRIYLRKVFRISATDEPSLSSEIE